MVRLFGWLVLMSLCWAGAGLAQTPGASGDCNSAKETRSVSKQEMARLCSGAAGDALSCYDGARRFLKANQHYLIFQDVLKCPDADIAELNDELVRARTIMNTTAFEATRMFLEEALTDRLFVLSLNTLKSYVCMTIVNYHVHNDKKIAPENIGNVLIEETLPGTARKGRQQIWFKSKVAGTMCGFVELPVADVLAESNFEDRAYFTRKDRFKRMAEVIAHEFFPGGARMQVKGSELSREFASMVSEYQSEYCKELKARKQGPDAVTQLTRYVSGEAIFIEGHAPSIGGLEAEDEGAWQDYKRFIDWVEKTLLK